MKSFTNIGNNKGRGIGVMMLMVTKYRKSLLQVEIIIKERQHKIQMGFVLLVVRNMEVSHVIERQELALVVENRDIWFRIVQQIRSLYLGSRMRRIKRINRSPELKGGYFL